MTSKPKSSPKTKKSNVKKKANTNKSSTMTSSKVLMECILMLRNLGFSPQQIHASVEKVFDKGTQSARKEEE